MPAKTYTDEDLGKTLDKLDHQLSKSEPDKEDTSADLVKALAAATKGAIDLATESKDRRKSKKKSKESPLAKAAKDDDDDKDDKDDDSKDDDDDDKLPAWLKDKVDDGKAAGEMQYAGDRDDYGGTKLMTNAGHESKQMGKSVQIGDMEVVDVGDFLAKSLRQIEDLSKALDRSERREKTLIKGLLAMEERLIHLEEQNEDQARFTSICAKALGHMLDNRETYLEQPAAPSRYASMEKSIALAQRQADHEGATYFKMKGEGSQSNMELLSKAVMTRKITPEQAAYIKKTERLPAGISLN
jgi:hypothetical protein